MLNLFLAAALAVQAPGQQISPKDRQDLDCLKATIGFVGVGVQDDDKTGLRLQENAVHVTMALMFFLGRLSGRSDRDDWFEIALLEMKANPPEKAWIDKQLPVCRAIAEGAGGMSPRAPKPSR
ncbi:MAG TPA: hypothetical protein VF559_11020 [Caulobacteraceae bacterium]|jgi:hypothetical protein